MPPVPVMQVIFGLMLAIPFGAFAADQLMSWSGRDKPLRMAGALVAPLLVARLPETVLRGSVGSAAAAAE